MDFLSDNLIFVGFIVIAIVFRIARQLVRKAERRKREERAEDQPETTVGGEMEYKHEAEKDEDDDEAFSAWALSVDDNNNDDAAAALPVSPAAPVPAVVPLFAQSLTAVPASSSFPALIEDSALDVEKYRSEAAFPFSAQESESSINVRSGSQSRGRNRNRGRSVVSAAFPGKLDYLPPLKRAVVLADILGPPKGL
jgi:hypothetical protein